MIVKYKYFLPILCTLTIISGFAYADTAAQVKKDKPSNPFEMVIFNIGSANFSSPTIKSGSFKPVPSEKSKNKIYELGVEVPFYKDYTALGFQLDIINGDKMAGTAYTLSAKFRLPMHFRFGHIALTNTYRAGLVSIFYCANLDDYDTTQFGFTATPAIGIDYFPIRWFGLYLEYSWNFTNIFLNRHDQYNYSGDKIGTVNNKYSFTTQGVGFGFKLTF